MLYGFGLNHSQCHFHFIYNELKNNRPVKLFTDQFRTPISLNDASSIIADLAETDITGEIVNLGGAERVSRYELGEMLCSIAGFDKNLIQKITMDEIPNYPKVVDVSLNIDKLRSLRITLRSIEESIKDILN